MTLKAKINALIRPWGPRPRSRAVGAEEVGEQERGVSDLGGKHGAFVVLAGGAFFEAARLPQEAPAPQLYVFKRVRMWPVARVALLVCLFE